MKMRTMLVDDEPFILQGLSVLIDWEAEGYEIVKTAVNGMEALEYLKKNQVDLIIADIKMPVMSGLQLLEIIREEKISSAYFIILSGYNDFQYAQKAIRYSCMDYILKPVQKEGLLKSLRNAVKNKEIIEKEAENGRRMQQAYLVQNLTTLLRGKYTQSHLQFVQENLRLSGGIRYIHISLSNIAALEEMSDSEVAGLRNRLFENCENFLGEDKNHCIRDILGYEEEYEVGFLCCDYMFTERGESLEEFLLKLLESASRELEVPVVILVGKWVENIAKISRSYSTACTLRSFVGFRTQKSIYYYEEEIQVNPARVVLCKQNLDRLIQAVEQNDRMEINKSVDDLFQEMETMGMSREMVSMNTNYLLFQLIHLAVEQDESVRQEEIMLYISEHVSEPGISRGSRSHMRKFACEYAEYLIQLRKNVSRGILLEVEREIREHYAENLTLRELSQKYFVNSSYLGQIFRKKYGQSFKDYLSNYRICEAAQQLLKTDKKISQIAEDVGYHDTDYFISKFIEQKGCTPSKYRKNFGGGYFKNV